MPKQKTHKASAKRFRVTKNGKVLARRAGKSHLMAGKRGKKRRALKRSKTLGSVDAKRYVKASKR
jgi:large subunit ribosomal protein L35